LRRLVSFPERLENAQFYGWLGWALAMAGIVIATRVCLRHRKESSDAARVLMMLLPVAIVGFLLSLGPFLWIGPRLYGIRMPFYHVYALVPPFRMVRATARFAVLVACLLGPAAAFALSRFRWFNAASPAVRFSAFGCVMAVMLFEYFPVEVPALFRPRTEPARILAAHRDLAPIAPFPLNNTRFMIETAKSLIPTPGGHTVGMYNNEFHRLMDLTADFPSTRSLAVYTAIGSRAIFTDDPVVAAAAARSPWLETVESGDWGALLRVLPLSGADAAAGRQLVKAIPRRPWLPVGDEFPAAAPESTRWIPSSWQWLDDANPPQWQSIPWESMAEPGFVYHDLNQVFYGPVAPRTMGDAARIHVSMAIKDPGVDYTLARVYWLTSKDASWNPEHTAEAFVRPDGTRKVVTFDLSARPAWNPGETLTALQFEPTTSPWPGERVRLYEIRIEPIPR